MSARPPIDVRELHTSERADAVRVLTDAFLEDPAWLAIGPKAAGHRRRVMDLFHRAALLKARRWGGVVHAAARDGAVAGIAVSYPGERWPPPEPWSTLVDVPPFLLSGPWPMRRALRVAAVMQRAHPHEPHTYLWLLAVDPRAQRSGVGAALLERVFADAEARATSVYLETANPANPPYYRRFGFRPSGEEMLPRGATMWFMWRRHAETAG